MLQVNPWNTATFDHLYGVFTRDFKNSRPTIDNRHVWFFQDMDDGKERIFWHLTHRKDRISDVRLPDPRRCERLPWIRSMIEHCYDPELLFWDYIEDDKSIGSYLWLKSQQFIVIMRKYPDTQRRLVTSYFVDQSGFIRSFERKYSQRVK